MISQRQIYGPEDSGRKYLKCWNKETYNLEFYIQQGYHTKLKQT